MSEARDDEKPPRPEALPSDREDSPDLPVRSPPRSAEDLAVVLGPLRDLAEAFRSHADGLRSLAEGQARMTRRLEKSDRSETVVQSTRALNETFRGVQRTQERLMTRLSREGRRPWTLLVGVLVLLGVFVGGTLYLLLGWVERRDGADQAREKAAVTRLVSDQTDRLEDLHERLGTKGEEAATLSRELDAERRRVEDLQARLTEKDDEIQDLLGARAALTRTLRENASLSSEVGRLSQELSRSRAELSKVRADLADRERELEELSSPGAEPSAVPPPSAEPGSEPVGARTAVPAEAVTNEGELRRIATMLNGLLLGTRESESYRFLRIGGARGTVLYDITAVDVDTRGNETKRIEAAECRVVLDEAHRRAELRFREGHVFYHGVRAPFWGGKYVVQVPDVDPKAWRRSGLTVIGDL